MSMIDIQKVGMEMANHLITELWKKADECGIKFIETTTGDILSTVGFFNADRSWCYRFQIPIVELLCIDPVVWSNMMSDKMDEFKQQCPKEASK